MVCRDPFKVSGPRRVLGPMSIKLGTRGETTELFNWSRLQMAVTICVINIHMGQRLKGP